MSLLKRVLRGLSAAWTVAFVGAFLAAGIAYFNTGEDETSKVILVFLLGQVLAGMFAITSAVLASNAPSPNIRRMAQVPLAGTSAVALVTLSLGAFIFLLT